MKEDLKINCGWGNLIFAHTYTDDKSLVDDILDENKEQRNIAFMVEDPHVVINRAPQRIFLDPSHTFSLDLNNWSGESFNEFNDTSFKLRFIEQKEDIHAINRIYQAVKMIPLDVDYVWSEKNEGRLLYAVAEDHEGEIIGVVNGVDHQVCTDDGRNEASIWALAVNPQAALPGIGAALTCYMIEHFKSIGRSHVSLSVLHNNKGAIKLYEKLGFVRIQFFSIKKCNPINESLYVDFSPKDDFNPYAQIIIEEALRRGIAVEPISIKHGHFQLSFGGRKITCWESLTEMTSAIAMIRCEDKQLTRDLALDAGLKVPEQLQVNAVDDGQKFLEKYEKVVVKPARGEQGQGISVGITTKNELRKAITKALKYDQKVILEKYYPGQDLRIIVINNEVVAAAVRKPPSIYGTGRHDIQSLIESASRRRAAATSGESQIPLDDETMRTVRDHGYDMHDVLPEGVEIIVRNTANLHTGGTIHDVTDELHPELSKAAVDLAIALAMPVVGLDFMVPDPSEPEYILIEANERPGLANHEPQPTAEKFVDMLFPQTMKVRS